MFYIIDINTINRKNASGRLPVWSTQAPIIFAWKNMESEINNKRKIPNVKINKNLIVFILGLGFLSAINQIRTSF